MTPAPKRRPPLVWTQTRRGHAFDLLEPRAEDVDFDEIAETLAHLPRFAGGSEKPISVAQHTLIAALAAPAWLRPWVLLHDAHEAYIGDITTPVVRALDAIWLEGRPARTGVLPSAAVAALKHRIDQAVHDAAGLRMPGEAERGAIALADRRALVTERRDFCARPPLSWGHEIEATAPLTMVFRYRKPIDVAAELAEAFRASLPVFLGAKAS
jgi:hypothetical protein